MTKTIEFGVFVEDADEGRLAEAQSVARSLGVSLTADGSVFAGHDGDGPLKVVVNLPAGASLTADAVRQGRDRLDALLVDEERLTDYALVKEDGVLTQVVSLLTAGVQSVSSPQAPAPAPAAPAAPAAPRRWSPFRR